MLTKKEMLEGILLGLNTGVPARTVVTQQCDLFLSDPLTIKEELSVFSFAQANCSLVINTLEQWITLSDIEKQRRAAYTAMAALEELSKAEVIIRTFGADHTVLTQTRILMGVIQNARNHLLLHNEMEEVALDRNLQELISGIVVHFFETKGEYYPLYPVGSGASILAHGQHGAHFPYANRIVDDLASLLEGYKSTEVSSMTTQLLSLVSEYMKKNSNNA
jgi:hypothetical protein